MICQPIENRFNSNISISTEKNFKGISCSNSSIGQHINIILSNLVKDCLTLYNKSYGKFNISEFSVDETPIGDLEFPTSNFFIHGNETFNNSVLQRIQTIIIETQEKIISIT
jgi:hypothetical protein